MKWIFLILLLSFSAYSENKILEIVNDYELKISNDSSIKVLLNDTFAIYSHESQKIIGFGIVSDLSGLPDYFLVKVKTHNESSLIRERNYLKKIDFLNLDQQIPGRFDLFPPRSTESATKYRPLVYTSIIHGMTASNLAKNEFLIGPSIFGYGITDKLQTSINLSSVIFGVGNIGLKQVLSDKESYNLSMENAFNYYFSNKRFSYLFTMNLDLKSNSNFKSYAKFKIFTKKPNDQTLSNGEEYKKYLNLELQFSYGYIFNNWSQLIFGPKVDINKKNVGGVLGYFMFDKNLNTLIGVSSSDFSDFRLGKQAYLLSLDFWWRF